MTNSNSRYKYPRTPHVPWSLGVTKDDKIIKSTKDFMGKEVVVTEKMDGENFTLYPDYCHARSIDSGNHNSRDWIKKLSQEIGYKIPEGFRVCGENVYAEHSISYAGLPSYFLVFSIWDNNYCLSWEDTVYFAQELNLTCVPVLYNGLYDEKLIQGLFTGESKCGGSQEGYVVRLAGSFALGDFSKSVMKFVRKNHVTSEVHWTNKKVQKNSLILM